VTKQGGKGMSETKLFEVVFHVGQEYTAIVQASSEEEAERLADSGELDGVAKEGEVLRTLLQINRAVLASGIDYVAKEVQA
jgi:hypothetical protein